MCMCVAPRQQAIALPSVQSSRLARNTQLILQHEADLTRVVDPWAGSYFMETLTADMERAATEVIDQVEALGGMTKAISAGIPNRMIQECAGEGRVFSLDDVRTGD